MQEERNSSPDLGLGTTVLAGMGATALIAVLFSYYHHGTSPTSQTSPLLRTTSVAR